MTLRHWFLGFIAPTLLTGCITSSPWEHGSTALAKATRMEACPNGLLDNAEDGDNQIVKVGGRDGYWFSFADALGTTIDPKGQFVMAQAGPPGSKHAARVKGTLAKSGDSLYAGLGFAFTNPKSPFDISKAKGFRFWAKGPGRIRFKAPDVNTAPEGDRCSDCYNDFGVDIYLQPDWQRYTVPFDKMTQQPGWGDRAPALEVKSVIAIQWQFSTPGADYDIWVDNIELVGCDAPGATAK